MKIVLLANNVAGWQSAEFLARRNDTEVVLLVVHPDEKQSYKREIKAALPHVPRIIEADRLDDSIDYIKATGAELALSVYFGYILREPFLSMFPRGIVNLHPAWLPFNRGAYPVAWSIIDGTPCGATLHYVDAGIDTGDIIAQKSVTIEPFDTGQSAYKKVERAGKELLEETWPLIVAGEADRVPQHIAWGSYHSVAELDKIRFLNLDNLQTIGETIDLLRGLSWPGGGARIVRDGNVVTVKVSME